MNIYEANMFDSRKLNLRLFIDAMKLDKQLTGSYTKKQSNSKTLPCEQYQYYNILLCRLNIYRLPATSYRF